MQDLYVCHLYLTKDLYVYHFVPHGRRICNTISFLMQDLNEVRNDLLPFLSVHKSDPNMTNIYQTYYLFKLLDPPNFTRITIKIPFCFYCYTFSFNKIKNKY